MALDDQRFKDHCLIIVGNGGKADEVLAKRRLAAGGRLAHFLTRPDDPRVTFSASADGLEYDFFTWQPPKGTMGISSFARKLQGKPRTFWTKTGPDGIELSENHHLTIRYGITGNPRHVTLTDETGNILVEMSGHVVVDADMLIAETLQVDVHNTELNAFGTFSKRFVVLALLFQVLWQIAKISLSINFELRAAQTEADGGSDGQVPWFRNLLAALNWCLTGNIICCEMTSLAFAGTRASINIHAVGNLAATVAIMAVSPLQLSEFVLCVVGVTAMISVTLPVHYYNTIGVNPNRRFLPHLLWTIAQISGTVGCFVLFGLIAQVYAQSLAATFFLPFGTAFAETGMVIFTRLMYNRFVHSNKSDPEGPLVGDQLYIPAPCLIMSAHAFAEGCRLTATLSGVIQSGGWNWIPTSMLSVALNLSARLGWSRFMLIQLGKKLCSGPKAMAIFAPTGWSKYHDELKIYAGYFRFAAIISLFVARLVSYGAFQEGPTFPSFNLSALWVLIFLLVGEVIEDEVVTRELLPVNPAGPGLLKVNANGDNADPTQLISLEHLPNVQQGDPWRMSELEKSGKLSLKRTSTLESVPSVADLTTPVQSTSPTTTTCVPQKVVSLGNSETDAWSRLRKWFGQPRSLNSSPALHGLRELPFAVQLSFVGIVAEFTLGLLALLVGAGYLRGTCENVLVGPDRILGLVYWELPLPC